MDPEEVRREMELQLEAWHKLPLGSQEEVSPVVELLQLPRLCGRLWVLSPAGLVAGS